MRLSVYTIYLSIFTMVLLACAPSTSLAIIPGDEHPITVNAWFTPSNITVGQNATFHWGSAPEATRCRVTGVPGVGGMSEVTSGSVTVSPSADLHARVQCFSKLHEGSDTATLSVISVPTVSANFEPSSIIVGETTTLTWSSIDAADCSADHGVNISGTSGSVDLSPATDLSVTVSCTGSQGTGSVTAHVSVQPVPPPTAMITFIPAMIWANAHESSELLWDSNYTDSCVVDTFNPYGHFQFVGTSGLVGPFYLNTDAYLACQGPGGTVTATAALFVMYPAGLAPPKQVNRNMSETRLLADHAVRAALGLGRDDNVQIKRRDLNGDNLIDQIIYIPKQGQLIIRFQNANGYHVVKRVDGIGRSSQLMSVRVRTDLSGASTIRVITSH